MKKWIAEDWEFEIIITHGKAGHCRLGLEEGDKFTFQYETPANFCPKTMIQLYTWCEVIRCGGDFTYRGNKEKYVMDLACADGCIHYRLTAKPINRDENGIYNGKYTRPED